MRVLNLLVVFFLMVIRRLWFVIRFLISVLFSGLVKWVLVIVVDILVFFRRVWVFRYFDSCVLNDRIVMFLFVLIICFLLMGKGVLVLGSGVLVFLLWG